VKAVPIGSSTQTMDPLNPVIPVPVDGIIMVTGGEGSVPVDMGSLGSQGLQGLQG